jgi:hypothetical protein
VCRCELTTEAEVLDSIRRGSDSTVKVDWAGGKMLRDSNVSAIYDRIMEAAARLLIFSMNGAVFNIRYGRFLPPSAPASLK